MKNKKTLPFYQVVAWQALPTIVTAAMFSCKTGLTHSGTSAMAYINTNLRDLEEINQRDHL
jgi:hypothetical protein